MSRAGMLAKGADGGNESRGREPAANDGLDLIHWLIGSLMVRTRL